MKSKLFRLANKLYEHCYPVYSPLYAAWKAFSDRRERELLRQYVRPGMTVVDVGANIGVYTRFFSRLVATSGRVYAFEPALLNFAHLQKNVGHFANVTLIHAAVGCCNGIIQLFVSEELNVDHRTFNSGDGRKAVDVPVVSLDEYFTAGHHVDLIKIDVQGYELSVLEGASRVLSENHDIKVLMEFWPYGLAKAAVSPQSVIELIKSFGFELWMTNGSGSVPFDGTGLDSNNINHYCNLIASKHAKPDVGVGI
ncbi:FkbM family methyltransferase [Nitratidesulfovibrio liaohensis]|uniref:FkbM family methyltransferase n=1 Tax=Nitratidesulfovibrio liaohensis TaxID=2604158 RepID=A0ABY9R3F4_9BACT|nr:FkbM family methyltransferase [Nitratidesulfovibrio liaohensis]WMW66264.1 FkbM family methyltransferase [Nitratidesulfovibrio liaohensis]